MTGVQFSSAATARAAQSPPLSFQSQRQIRASVRDVAWWRDPTAIAVALVINGYPISAIVATLIGQVESSLPSIIVRLAMLATVTFAFAVSLNKGRVQKLGGMLVLLWVAYVTRLLYDWQDPEIDGTDIALLFFLLTCVYPAAAIASIRSTWNDQNVARALLVSGLVVCLGALWLKDTLVGADALIETTGRLSFAKLNPVTLGHVGCTTMLSALVLWFGTHYRWRLVAACSTVVAVALIIVAASRGAIVTFGLCAALYILCRRMWIYAAVIGGLLVIAVASFALFDVEQLMRQTGMAKVGTDASSLERLKFITLGIEEVKAHWQFGSSYTLPFGLGWPHNIMLESFMAMGIMGFTLFCVLCLRAGVAAARSLAADQSVAALLFFQFLFAGQFSGSLWGGWPGLWLGMAMLLSGSSRRRLRRAVPFQ